MLTIELSPRKLNNIRPSWSSAISPIPSLGGAGKPQQRDQHSTCGDGRSQAAAALLRGFPGHDSWGEEPSPARLPPLPRGQVGLLFLKSLPKKSCTITAEFGAVCGKGRDRGTGGKPPRAELAQASLHL